MLIYKSFVFPKASPAANKNPVPPTATRPARSNCVRVVSSSAVHQESSNENSFVQEFSLVELWIRFSQSLCLVAQSVHDRDVAGYT